MSNLHPKKNKIILAISGGVDSAVAAYLLKQQGHNVQAVFMKNWSNPDNDPYCQGETDLTDARAVCDQLDIALEVVNFEANYQKHVFQYFLDEYAVGRTPNPDILCNSKIKFQAFLTYALSKEADFIATGHYARIQSTKDGYQLLKGLDNTKDQSYFLHALNTYQLQHSLFPIGHLKKTQVRQIAKDIGLVNHNKKDSTGICFIGKRPFKQFLNEYLLAQPGDIETDEGQKIGHHDGLMFYTIGQRKGLGIGGQRTKKMAPWYVIDKDIERNVLKVCQDNNHPRLYANTLICSSVHFINGHPPKQTYHCKAKIRYRHHESSCILKPYSPTIHTTHQTYQVHFEKQQRAITPGQYIVFYNGDVCLGGGIIETALQ